MLFYTKQHILLPTEQLHLPEPQNLSIYLDNAKLCLEALKLSKIRSGGLKLTADGGGCHSFDRHEAGRLPAEVESGQGGAGSGELLGPGDHDAIETRRGRAVSAVPAAFRALSEKIKVDNFHVDTATPCYRLSKTVDLSMLKIERCTTRPKLYPTLETVNPWIGVFEQHRFRRSTDF